MHFILDGTYLFTRVFLILQIIVLSIPDVWCGQNDEYVFQSLSTVGTYSNGEKSRSGFILLYYIRLTANCVGNLGTLRCNHVVGQRFKTYLIYNILIDYCFVKNCPFHGLKLYKLLNYYF
jgi:hypothetical protein